MQDQDTTGTGPGQASDLWPNLDTMTDDEVSSIASEPFEVLGPEPVGFTIMYHETIRAMTRLCHGTVCRVWLHLATYANSAGEAFPSIDRMASEMDIERKTVMRAIADARKKGFLRVERRSLAGKKIINRYRLAGVNHSDFTVRLRESSSPTGGTSPGTTGGTSPGRAIVPRVGPERYVERDRDRLSDSRVIAPSAHAALSKADQERGNPYWTAARASQFKVVYDAYPKKVGKIDAMGAWRKTVGSRCDTSAEPTETALAIWNGLQGWITYWDRERTEERFIPNLSTFLNGERWDEQPSGGTR